MGNRLGLRNKDTYAPLWVIDFPMFEWDDETSRVLCDASPFYISQKLGDGKIMLIGDVIEGQYVANNLHFAAAIAFILMILLLVCMAVMRKLASRHVEGGL